MSKMEILTSRANPLLKEVRRAVARGTLTRDGFLVAESLHLVEEALKSGCEIQAVLAAESARHRVGSGVRVLVLPDALFRGISGTETSQGVLALVRPPSWELHQLAGGRALVVVLDGVQDPGNAGAIVRAAEAFGATGVVFLKGTVNPYNPKAVRASAGSVFRVPLAAAVEQTAALAALRDLVFYAATPSGATALGEADLARPCAIVIGSEGRGISRQVQARAAGLRIPTSGVESLNAAMAAGIVLYEAWRQREALPSP